MSTGVESYYEDESFRDHVSHIDQQGKRVWFYPKRPSGRLYKWRTLLSIAFLAVLFTVPFITVNGNPLFLFNVIERKFILFGVRFWPQDFFLFVLGMLIFVIFIALFTVVYGRVFCGWVCPQTIFMEMVFRKIEYWIEGDATHQKALNKMPWNAEKIRKKGLKLAIFYLLSFLIANMFLSYIIGVNELYKIITEPLSMHIGGFLAMIIFSGVFFFVFAWFREQACLVVCPYGRMQGVLLAANPASGIRKMRTPARVIALTATNVCGCVRPALTSATERSSNARTAQPALMPATTSWKKWIVPKD
jgi:polyferredoxin